MKQKEWLAQTQQSNVGQPMVLGELPGDLFSQNNVSNTPPPGQLQQYQASAYGDIQRHTSLSVELPQGGIGGETVTYPVHVQSTFDTRPINSQEFILENEVPFSPSNVGNVAVATASQAGMTRSGVVDFIYAPGFNKVYALTSDGAGTGRVTVTDGTSGALVTNIAGVVSSGYGPHAIVYCPLNNKIYATNSGAGTIAVIDPTTDTITSTISVGGVYFPQEILFVADTGLLYVYNNTGALGRPSIAVITPITGALVVNVDLPAGSVSFGGMIYSSVSKSIYMDRTAGGSIAVFNTLTNTFSASFTLPAPMQQPWPAVISPSNGFIYAVNANTSESVMVINPANNSLVTQIQDPNALTHASLMHGIVYVPSVNLIAVAISISGDTVVPARVLFIDPATQSVVGQANIASPSFTDPTQLVFNPANGYLFVSNNVGLKPFVFVIDPATFTNIFTFDFSALTDQGFSDIIINSTGSFVYIRTDIQGAVNTIPQTVTLPLTSLVYSATGTIQVPTGFVGVIRDFRYEITPIVNYDMTQVNARFDINGSVVPFHDLIKLGPVVEDPQITHLIAGERSFVNFTVTVSGLATAPSMLNTILHGEFLPSHGFPPNWEIGSML